jgi:hypothetical protein
VCRSAILRGARARLVVGAIAVSLAVGGCVSAPPAPTASGPDDRRAVPGFSFARDTFAFRNDVRAHHPDRDDLYANYCFVLARGLRQFFRFARFDAAAPRLDREGYVERVRQVVARPPRHPTPPADDRMVIPGYASLREFSRAEESAVKEGLGGRFWTWVHWTNWRVIFPVSRAHQAHVLEEIRADLAAGRLVQLLVTNWPTPELNHTVVAFEWRGTAHGVELTVWDPNDPDGLGLITFDTARGHFWATRVYDTRPGVIRVFRMYYSALL